MQHKMPVKSSLVFQYAVLYFSFVILGVIVTMILAVFLPKGVVSLNGYVVLYIIGIILGLMSCKIFLTVAKKSGDKFCKLELSEGYTDETLSEAYKLFNRSEKNLWKMSCFHKWTTACFLLTRQMLSCTIRLCSWHILCSASVIVLFIFITVGHVLCTHI